MFTFSSSVAFQSRAWNNLRQPHDLTPMTVEDTFKSIVLSTATTTTALSNDQGVKTRGMKNRSLLPAKMTASNDKHNPTVAKPSATRKRALSQLNENNDVARSDIARPDTAQLNTPQPNTAQPEPVTPSHKKQKMSPTDTIASKDSAMSSVDTPATTISTGATTTPAKTSNADTANPRETKPLSKAAARTKLEVQRQRALDRARRAEARAKMAEDLLMLAHNGGPEKLKQGVLQFFQEQLAIKNEQVENLGQQVEAREIEVAQQKGRIQSHVDWEKTYKAKLAEVKEELKTESALVMDYLKIIGQNARTIKEQTETIQRLQGELDGSGTVVPQKDEMIEKMQAETIQRLQGELDGLRKVVAQKDEMIKKMQAERKTVKGALESIRHLEMLD